MIYAAYFIGSFWLLWVFFLAVMNLKENQNNLKGFVRACGLFTLFVGRVIDLVVQVGPASILWLELPRELTVSDRVARLVKEGHGYRYNLAVWFRSNLLAPFDKSGSHGEV